jgi:hypothetical protein
LPPKYWFTRMKQTNSSIIIVRNVWVLTSASMIVYLFFTRSWSAIIRVQILCHAHIICITVLENRIICCQIFCDLLLKSAFEQIFNDMQLILVKIKWKYLIGKIIAHTQCSVDENIYIYIYIPCVPHKNNCKKKNWFTWHETDRFLNNHCQECVGAYLSIHDIFLFFTRSWSAIIGPKFSPRGYDRQSSFFF